MSGLPAIPSPATSDLSKLLSGLSYLTCLVYLDDIIVFGRSVEEQLKCLGEVFERVAKANLKLKPLKCSLCQRSVQFLGHSLWKTDGAQVSPKGITVKRKQPPGVMKAVLSRSCSAMGML